MESFAAWLYKKRVVFVYVDGISVIDSLYRLIVYGIILCVLVNYVTGNRSICYEHPSTGAVDIYMQLFISRPHS